MNREKLQIGYKPVEPITPVQAKEFGIVTDIPVFVETGYKGNKTPSVFRIGSTIETRAHQELQRAMLSESVGSFGYVPFTGFIAVGETQYITDLNRIQVEKMHVLGVMAFINESQVKQGYVREYIETTPDRSHLIIDTGEGIATGEVRYPFRITQEGKALFGRPLKVVSGTENIGVQKQEPVLGIKEIMQAIRRGEVVKITQPIEGFFHELTRRVNSIGAGYVSLEKLSKEQIMGMYQELELKRRNDIV